VLSAIHLMTYLYKDVDFQSSQWTDSNSVVMGKEKTLDISQISSSLVTLDDKLLNDLFNKIRNKTEKKEETEMFQRADGEIRNGGWAHI